MVSYNHKYSSHGEFTLPRPQINRRRESEDKQKDNELCT